MKPNSPQFASTLTAGSLQQQLNSSANQQLLALSGSPVCDISVYRYDYNTVGARGEATTASAALMIPNGADARCHGGRPILLYGHGTSIEKAYNMADLSGSASGEDLMLTAIFAAQGYIVVAPNYTGYDTSTLGYHPYLNADAQSKDMIDALYAGRLAMPATGVTQTTDGGKLFITGYSQGGYAAVATQRAMQSAHMPVTAAAPISGPYALAAYGDMVFNGQVAYGAPTLFTFMLTGYQQAYGNVYANSTDVFESSYATGIDSLLPFSGSAASLYAYPGKIPQFALFNSTPPTQAEASITPATQPAAFAQVFSGGFASYNLITNGYRLNYLADARANPDGGWPVVTTGTANTGSTQGFRQALVLNDLRSGSPSAPTLLCGGSNDPIVFWTNTQLLQGYWASHPPTSVSVLDLEAATTNNDSYASMKNGFSGAKQAVAQQAVSQGASDGGASAVLDVYHTTLVPPFCMAAVRSFFAGM